MSNTNQCPSARNDYPHSTKGYPHSTNKQEILSHNFPQHCVCGTPTCLCNANSFSVKSREADKLNWIMCLNSAERRKMIICKFTLQSMSEHFKCSLSHSNEISCFCLPSRTIMTIMIKNCTHFIK